MLDRVIFTNNLLGHTGCVPVRRGKIITPFDTENNTIADRCFGSCVEELYRVASENQIARLGIALCWIGVRSELHQIQKTVKVEVVRISSITAVVRATEVLNTPRLQIRNSCPRESNVERIFVCVVARDVQGSGSHAERGRGELDGESRASAGHDWRCRGPGYDEFRRIRSVKRDRKTGQVCTAGISNCECAGGIRVAGHASKINGTGPVGEIISHWLFDSNFRQSIDYDRDRRLGAG